MIRTTIVCLICGMLLLSACGSGSGPTQEQEDCYARSVSAARVATLRQAELWDNEIDDVTALATIMEGEALLAEDGETFTAWLLDRFPDADEDTLSELISIAVCFGSEDLHEWMDAAPPTADPAPASTTTTLEPCGEYARQAEGYVVELTAIIADAAEISKDMSDRTAALANSEALRGEFIERFQPLADRADQLQSQVHQLDSSPFEAQTFLSMAMDGAVRSLERVIRALGESNRHELSSGLTAAVNFGKGVEQNLESLTSSLENDCATPTTTTSSTTTQPPATTTTLEAISLSEYLSMSKRELSGTEWGRLPDSLVDPVLISGSEVLCLELRAGKAPADITRYLVEEMLRPGEIDVTSASEATLVIMVFGVYYGCPTAVTDMSAYAAEVALALP